MSDEDLHSQGLDGITVFLRDGSQRLQLRPSSEGGKVTVEYRRSKQAMYIHSLISLESDEVNACKSTTYCMITFTKALLHTL